MDVSAYDRVRIDKFSSSQFGKLLCSHLSWENLSNRQVPSKAQSAVNNEIKWNKTNNSDRMDEESIVNGALIDKRKHTNSTAHSETFQFITITIWIVCFSRATLLL